MTSARISDLISLATQRSESQANFPKDAPNQAEASQIAYKTLFSSIPPVNDKLATSYELRFIGGQIDDPIGNVVRVLTSTES